MSVEPFYMVFEDNRKKEFEKWKSMKDYDRQGSTNHKNNTYSPKHISNVEEPHTFLTKFLIFLAFAIPVSILGYAFYINYLPFGYENTYSLTIDESGIISPLSNEIYLTNSQGRKLLSLPDGVQGQVNVVLNPNVILKDARANITVEGEGVYLATPINISDIVWDYNWDFSQSIPQAFQGTATYDSEQQCAYFNAYGEETLYLPDSEDMFESGPMSVYAKWKPSQVSKLLGNNQQIVGHYNWEIWQSENNVQFRVGRMNDINGTFYSVSYPIDPNFFGKEHEALAIYSPNVEGSGYIELWVDGNLGGRTSILSDKIYEDYNSEKDLSFGWSPHNYEKNPYFDGCLYSTKIIDEVFLEQKQQSVLYGINNSIVIPIIGNGNITSVRVMISK